MNESHAIARSIERIFDSVQHRLSELERDVIRLFADTLLASELNMSTAKELSRLLENENLANRWNHILDENRASHLASSVAEILPNGSRAAIDLFCGTGTVSQHLKRLGWDVSSVERSSFNNSAQRTTSQLDYDTCRKHNYFSERQYDVVLVIASLHHEPNLDDVIGWMTSIPTSSYLVIENLRTPTFSTEIHKRFDWFFNYCLNEFCAPCPGWYWTKKQWESCLSTLGDCKWLHRDNEIPGIPFPYDYFLVTPQAIAL